MDGSFMEDLWKGLVLWVVFIGVACFLLGAGVVGLVVWLT